MTDETKQTETGGEGLPQHSSGETLGSFFRKARQGKNKTLDEIAEKTRIHVSTLKAIESDNRNVLPAEVFTRGFIKIYAQNLDLDPDQMLNWYMQQGDDARPLVPDDNINVQEVLASESLAESPSGVTGRLVFVAMVLFVVLIGYWGYNSLNAPIETPTTVIEKPVSEPVAEQELPTEVATVSETQEQQPGEEATTVPLEKVGEPSKVEIEELTPGSQEVAVETEQQEAEPEPQLEEPAALPEVKPAPVTEEPTPVPTEPAEEQAKEEQASPESSGAQQEDTTPVVVPSEPIESQVTSEEATAGATEESQAQINYVLEASFIETTWLRVQVDGKKAREYTYQAGDNTVWKAEKEIKLFLGNAGGVAMVLNDKPLPPLGKKGKTLRITLPRPTDL